MDGLGWIWLWKSLVYQWLHSSCPKNYQSLDFESVGAEYSHFPRFRPLNIQNISFSQELLKPNFGEKSSEKSTSNREAGNAQFYAGSFRQVRPPKRRILRHNFLSFNRLKRGSKGTHALTKYDLSIAGTNARDRI